MLVKTRFAPSPTGSLHMGSVRTALFSWLYARHCKGQFILRIEDTDRERSTAASTKIILDGMQWLGLNYDAGPFYQTERYDRYKQMANQLLNTDNAYRCACSAERLEILRNTQLTQKEKPRYDGHCRNKNISENIKHVIRFKNPIDGYVTFIDKVYGEIKISNQELDDFILIRSDGNATYNFAVVIDDWDMEITHVIRGDDHINNTPKQINLFNALNAPLPIFAHLPMILGDDGKRLSKRHGAVSVLEFKEQGYLPQALLNYLLRLGWSCGDMEIFDIETMIAKFDLTHINRSSASFNYAKLQWLNQHYIKTSPSQEIITALTEQFIKNNINIQHGAALQDIIPIFADRCKTLEEIAQKSLYLYQDHINYDETAIEQYWQIDIYEPLQQLYQKLLSLKDWNVDSIKACLKEISTEFAINLGNIAQPLRIAMTGSTVSPSIDIILKLLGKQRVLQRLQYALQTIKQQR